MFGVLWFRRQLFSLLNLGVTCKEMFALLRFWGVFSLDLSGLFINAKKWFESC